MRFLILCVCLLFPTFAWAGSHSYKYEEVGKISGIPIQPLLHEQLAVVLDFRERILAQARPRHGDPVLSELLAYEARQYAQTTLPLWLVGPESPFHPAWHGDLAAVRDILAHMRKREPANMMLAGLQDELNGALLRQGGPTLGWCGDSDTTLNTAEVVGADWSRLLWRDNLLKGGILLLALMVFGMLVVQYTEKNKTERGRRTSLA